MKGDITLEEAFEVLARAVQVLGPERVPPKSTAQATVETARKALRELQIVLILMIDQVDPETMADKNSDAVTLTVPMTPAQLEAIKRLGKDHGEEHPELTASRIILSWLKDNDVA